MTQRKDKIEGEGSYSGTKDYNERQRKFMESDKVQDAARRSQPKSESEKQEMQTSMFLLPALSITKLMLQIFGNSAGSRY